MEIAILLAAFGTLRRAEICALTSQDISGNTITVRHNMVKTPDNQWIIKDPKTPESYRSVEFPAVIVDRFRHCKGRLVHMHPDLLTRRFGRMLQKLDVPHFRFHDLRHYSASIMHAIGVPDQYIMKRGGWKTDSVLKSTYRNVIDLEAKRQQKNINARFETIYLGQSEEVSHEVSHGHTKAL